MKAMITASNSHQLVKQRRHWQRLKENKIVVVFRYVCCVFICTRMKKCCDRVRFCDEHLKAKKAQIVVHFSQSTANFFAAHLGSHGCKSSVQLCKTPAFICVFSMFRFLKIQNEVFQQSQTSKKKVYRENLFSKSCRFKNSV